MHRDLKPENIVFLDDESTIVKIIDFGSASFFKKNEYLSKRTGNINNIKIKN